MAALAAPKALMAVALIVGGVGSLILARGDADLEVSDVDPPKPSGAPMAATMMRLGLDAECLAAAGVSAQDVAVAIADAISDHDSHVPSLEQADGDFTSCKPICDALERKIKAGLDSGTDLADYQEAAAELVTVTAVREGVLDALFESGISKLSAAQQATLRTIRDNRHWKLPVQYLVVDREEADWVELRDMLDARRIYAEDEYEDEPQEVTTFLAGVDGDAAVATAKANFDASIAAVQTAWNVAVD